MKNIPLLIGTIIGTVALIVGVAFFFSNQTTQQAAQQQVDPQVAAGDARHSKGATESAKVTIVEFSDFQCPACKAAEPAVRSVLAQYENDVQFIYRHFPLDSIHPNSRTAAYAAEAASEDGKFWEMHELLFARQSDWSSISSRDELKDYFGTEEIRVKKGANLTVEITNTDGEHDFVIDELNVATDTIPEGETVTVTIPTDTVGEFAYYCSVGEHRALGMEGMLIIEE